MFVDLKKFYIKNYNKEGETGFLTAIYFRNLMVGYGKRCDGMTKIEDIQFSIKPKYKAKILGFINRFDMSKLNLKIDNELVTKLTPELMVFLLISNHEMIQEVKKYKNKKLVAHFANENFFTVLDLPDNLMSIEKVKKDRPNVRFGKQILRDYEDLKN